MRADPSPRTSAGTIARIETMTRTLTNNKDTGEGKDKDNDKERNTNTDRDRAKDIDGPRDKDTNTGVRQATRKGDERRGEEIGHVNRRHTEKEGVEATMRGRMRRTGKPGWGEKRRRSG